MQTQDRHHSRSGSAFLAPVAASLRYYRTYATAVAVNVVLIVATTRRLGDIDLERFWLTQTVVLTTVNVASRSIQQDVLRYGGAFAVGMRDRRLAVLALAATLVTAAAALLVAGPLYAAAAAGYAGFATVASVWLAELQVAADPRRYHRWRSAELSGAALAVIALAVTRDGRAYFAVACAAEVAWILALQQKRQDPLDAEPGSGVTHAPALAAVQISAWFALSQVLLTADRFVVAGYSTPGTAGKYAAAQALVLGIANAISSPLLSHLHPDYMRRRQAGAPAEVLLRSYVVVLAATTAGLTLVALLLRRPLEAAMSATPTVSRAAPVMAAAAGIYWIAMVLQKPLERDVRYRVMLVGMCVAVAAFLATAVTLSRRLGPLGAATGTLVGAVAYAMWVQFCTRSTRVHA